MPTQRIDLARVGITTHAYERWGERIGLEFGRLRTSLLRSMPASRRMRRRIREAGAHGKHSRPTRVRVDRETGAVFVIVHGIGRSSGSSWAWTLATVLPLWACVAGGEVIEREDAPCTAAT